MTGEQLRRHVQTRPFVPFRMYLADGRVVRVDHPEWLLYIPGARACVVADVRLGVYDTIGLLLVTSIRTGAEPSPRRRRRSA